MKESFLKGIRDGRTAVRIGIRNGGVPVTDRYAKRLIFRELQTDPDNHMVASYIAGMVIGELRGLFGLMLVGNRPNHIIVTLDEDGKPKFD